MRGVPISRAEAAVLFPGAVRKAIMAPPGLEDSVGALDTVIEVALLGGVRPMPVIRSKWVLEAHEVELLAGGGAVWLAVFGQALPPVAMQVIAALPEGDA